MHMAIIKSTEVLKRIKSGEKKNIPPPFFFPASLPELGPFI